MAASLPAQCPRFPWTQDMERQPPLLLSWHLVNLPLSHFNLSMLPPNQSHFPEFTTMPNLSFTQLLSP